MGKLGESPGHVASAFLWGQRAHPSPLCCADDSRFQGRVAETLSEEMACHTFRSLCQSNGSAVCECTFQVVTDRANVRKAVHSNLLAPHGGVLWYLSQQLLGKKQLLATQLSQGL